MPDFIADSIRLPLPDRLDRVEQQLNDRPIPAGTFEDPHTTIEAAAEQAAATGSAVYRTGATVPGADEWPKIEELMRAAQAGPQEISAAAWAKTRIDSAAQQAGPLDYDRYVHTDPITGHRTIKRHKYEDLAPPRPKPPGPGREVTALLEEGLKLLEAMRSPLEALRRQATSAQPVDAIEALLHARTKDGGRFIRPGTTRRGFIFDWTALEGVAADQGHQGSRLAAMLVCAHIQGQREHARTVAAAEQYKAELYKAERSAKEATQG